MSSFTDYLENKVLDYVFGSLATFSKPTVYIGLFSAAPSDTGGGTELSSTGGYVRVAAGSLTVSGTSPTLATNGAAIEWAAASANWSAAVTHLALFDASTAGNMLAWAPLTTSRTVNSGDVFRIPAGDLDVTLV
jgi:hypothetical protein